MEIKIEKPEVIKVIMGDKTYEMIKPKMKHQLQFEAALKEAQDGKASSIKVMVDFVASLGIPEEVLLDLEQESFLSLIEQLNGTLNAKKK